MTPTEYLAQRGLGACHRHLEPPSRSFSRRERHAGRARGDSTCGVAYPGLGWTADGNHEKASLTMQRSLQ